MKSLKIFLTILHTSTTYSHSTFRIITYFGDFEDFSMSSQNVIRRVMDFISTLYS